jgi:hypothetical protein
LPAARSRLTITLFTAGSLTVAGLLLGSPAHASLTSGDTYLFGEARSDTGCTVDVPPSPLDEALKDDGVAVSRTDARSGTIASKTSPTDITDVKIGSHIGAVVTPLNGRPASIKVAGSAHASVAPRVSGSTCKPAARANGEAEGRFDLPTGMWANVSSAVTTPDGGYLQLGIYPQDTKNNNVGVYVEPTSGTATARLFLPAGSYYFYAEIYTDTDSSHLSVSVAGSLTVSLTPAGYASPAVGKGKSYVALGGRSCSTNAVGGRLTNAVRKAKKVTVKVNGRTRGTFTGKHLTARAFALTHLAPTSPATVVATITPRKGRNVTVTRRYLACR